MKKLFVLALSLMTFTQTVAQENTTEKDTLKKGPKIDLYIGIGASFYDNFKINNNLRATGMPEIEDVLPELAIGFYFLGETYLVDVEFATALMDRRNSLARNQLYQFTTRARGHYNFVNDKKWILSGGLNLAFSRNDLNLNSRNNVIDLNDLNPETQSNHISLRNHMLFAGPSIGLTFKNKDKIIGRLNIGYEFALTNGKWKSDFGRVQNTVREQGVNRFMVGLIF